MLNFVPYYTPITENDSVGFNLPMECVYIGFALFVLYVAYMFYKLEIKSDKEQQRKNRR